VDLNTIGWICIAYCAVTLLIVGLRPKAVWNISKIQAFVSLLGETGARLFIGGWGLLVGAPGIYLVFFYNT